MAKTTSRRNFFLVLVGLPSSAALLRGDSTPGPQVQAADILLPGELKYAKQRADLCGAGNAVGGGLRGDYFSAPEFGGAVLLTRIDRSIDFDAGLDLSAEQAGRVQSVRWTGWIKPPVPGHFQFHADAPGLRVKVTQIWMAGQGAQTGATTAMALGRFYPITIELATIDRSYKGRWRLEWTAPHGLRFVIPTALLFGPIQ